MERVIKRYGENPKIYSVGYSAPGWTPDLLKMATKEWNAIVIDTRFVAWTPKQGWDGKQLANLLGKRYIHVPAFGNKNYKTHGNIEIADMDGGLRSISEWGYHSSYNFIALCTCASHDKCHRRLVMDAIAERFCFDIVTQAKPPVTRYIQMSMF